MCPDTAPARPPLPGWLTAALMVGALCTAACGHASESRRTLHVEPSHVEPVVIYETDVERCMTFTHVGNPNAESCYRLADPQAVAFDYTRMMISALLVQPAPRRVLIIGLGGGTLARTLAMLVPDVSIDNVEIDPAVVRMATRYFDFRSSPTQRVHIDDGRAFVVRAAQTNQRYDMIMLDAFGEDYIPSHLMTREFLSELRRALAPGGIVVANTQGEGPLYDRETATYQAVFATVLSFPARNRIIMASPDRLPDDDALRRHDARWRGRLAQVDIDSQVFFDRLQHLPAGTCPPGTRSSRVLTDATIDQALRRADTGAHLP